MHCLLHNLHQSLQPTATFYFDPIAIVGSINELFVPNIDKELLHGSNVQMEKRLRWSNVIEIFIISWQRSAEISAVIWDGIFIQMWRGGGAVLRLSLPRCSLGLMIV